MSDFLKISVPESADDAYIAKQAARELGQQPQDEWGDDRVNVSVGSIRDAQRANFSVDDVYENIPESKIEPFPDLESQLQAQEHPLYRTSAAYRHIVERRVMKTNR